MQEYLVIGVKHRAICAMSDNGDIAVQHKICAAYSSHRRAVNEHLGEQIEVRHTIAVSFNVAGNGYR